MNNENQNQTVERGDKIKSIVVCAVMAIFMFGFSLLCLFMPKPEFLDSERRPPAELPPLTVESIMKDGAEYGDSFMKKFDDKYAPDNFPFRDAFRSIKAFVVNYVFNHKDKDGVFMVDGYIGEMQEAIDKDSIQYAADRFKDIYEKFLKDKGITPYLSIIPDKSYFLAEQNGYLSMDYKEFVDLMTESADFAKYIDIFGALTLEDYYKTDTHWRQEGLLDVAELLITGMGGQYSSTFQKNTLDFPFYGVYSGRVGRPVKPETIYYLTNNAWKNVTVTDWEKGKPIQIDLYDMNKATGRDPYDMFLGGEKSLVTIENPDAKTDKELIIFRDSFGRSIIPLLVENYAKITVVDIRYQSANTLFRFLSQMTDFEFEDQDVLFLYSTLVLNASSEMKK